MKKILSVLAVLAVASAAFAQGTVLVSAPGNSIQYKAPLTSSAAQNVAAGGGFLQVLWAPTGSAMTQWSSTQSLATWLTANPAWKIAKASDNTTDFSKSISNAGRLLATGVQVGTAANPTAPVDLILIGWTGSAASFDAAWGLAGEPSANGVTVGFSNPVLNVAPATGTTPPPTAAFTGVTMTPTAVPEPSTFALAGLGAAALMIFRRRK